jgi:hypothetical protein
MRSPVLVVALASVALLVSCYNPQIEDGSLGCSDTFACPAGFKCNQSDGRCYKSGSIPPSGGTGGTGGAGGAGGTGGRGGAGGGGMGGGGMGGAGGTGGADMCTAPMGVYGPFTGCTPKIDSTCDPVCQAGCKCGERCKLEGGSPTCRAQAAPFAGPYEACNPDPKLDTCRPGLICLQENDARPACAAHCYKHCRADGDCTMGAKCSIEIQFGAMTSPARVCSPPPEACTPWGAARCGMPGQRPYPTFACYVMSNMYPDVTICDCAGTAKPGDPCMFEHDCEPGSECVVFQMARTCRRVCAVGATTALTGGCPVGMACNTFPNSTKWGYCR